MAIRLCGSGMHSSSGGVFVDDAFDGLGDGNGIGIIGYGCGLLIVTSGNALRVDMMCSSTSKGSPSEGSGGGAARAMLIGSQAKAICRRQKVAGCTLKA